MTFTDLLSEWRVQAADRLRNPLLGAFTAAWLVANWRIVSVFLFSETPIEDRIAYIEKFYLNASTLLVYPLTFAIVFVVLMPWASWLVQYPQELAFLKRKKHKLLVETDYLKSSVDKAQAQARLNQILAKEQITQRQQEELNKMRRHFEEQQEKANAQIAATQEELERKRREIEEKSEGDLAEAEKAHRELDHLRMRLEKEQQQAYDERRRVQTELRQAREEFEARLKRQDDGILSSTGIDFEDALLSRTYRLYHNPGVGPERSKLMKFGKGGRVLEGGNKNEYKWRIVEGKLEFVQSDGSTHSRFYFLPDSQIFIHTGDSDTPSARGQYIVPETPDRPGEPG